MAKTPKKKGKSGAGKKGNQSMSNLDYKVKMKKLKNEALKLQNENKAGQRELATVRSNNRQKRYAEKMAGKSDKWAQRIKAAGGSSAANVAVAKTNESDLAKWNSIISGNPDSEKGSNGATQDGSTTDLTGGSSSALD